ncbi:MAG: DMT family transporter [Rhodospirillales bacterium]
MSDDLAPLGWRARIGRRFADSALGRSPLALHAAYLLVLIPSIFWASNVVVARAVVQTTPPVAMTFWRWAGAIVVLAPFAIPKVIAQRALLRQHWKELLLFAILGVVGFNMLVYLALPYTTAVNATLIQGCIPAAVLCTSWLLFRTKVSRRMIVGTVASFLGLLVVISTGDPAVLAGLHFNHADLVMTGAIWVWALYIALQKRMPATIDPLAFLFAIAVIGELFIFVLYVSEVAGPMEFDAPSWKIAALSYIAIFPTALAYYLWNRGILKLGANAGAQSQYLIPVFGAIFAMIFLGESFHWYHGVGIALILGGIYMAVSKQATAAK